MTDKLAWLEPVPLREAWANEAFDFTPWLHEEENLQALADALGFEQLEPSGREIAVGPFSADILAEDIAGGKVLIENQLEQSDHDHLGKCLTYAAGLDAKTIIWICAKVRDEHLAAVNLLNEVSDDEFSFFAVELELYRIGDSPLAPKFEVVAKPNNWSRTVKRQAKEFAGELNETQKAHKAYWSGLIKLAEDQYPALARRVAFKGNFQYAETLSVGYGLRLFVVATRSRQQGLRAELYFGGEVAKRAIDFARSFEAREGMLVGETLTWEMLEMKRDCRLAIYYPEQRGDDPVAHDAEREWLLVRLQKLAPFARAVTRALKDDPSPLQIEAE